MRMTLVQTLTRTMNQAIQATPVPKVMKLLRILQVELRSGRSSYKPIFLQVHETNVNLAVKSTKRARPTQ